MSRYRFSLTPERREQIMRRLLGELALGTPGVNVLTEDGPLYVGETAPPRYDPATGQVVRQDPAVKGAAMLPRLIDLFPPEVVDQVSRLYASVFNQAMQLLDGQLQENIEVEQSGAGRARVLNTPERPNYIPVSYERLAAGPKRR